MFLHIERYSEILAGCGSTLTLRLYLLKMPSPVTDKTVLLSSVLIFGATAPFIASVLVLDG